jgi:ABC-type multidrug transport system ATPase subunit
MSRPAIAAADLGYSYGEVRAVDGVGFEVGPGEILGFLGPNGAGKSTTIKMLTGQLRPQQGEIEILGMALPEHLDDVQSRIGVCFEEKNLYTAMTGKENLAFFARLFGIRRFDPDPLLDRVGLGGRGDDRVSEYSKGMRQRLMMARALVNDPDVLFLDEPTDGLDPVSARSVRRIIEEEAQRGAAVLLTTHDMHEADSLSNRVAFINRGRILALDAPETLKLEHGKRSVRLRFRSGDTVEEEVVPLDDARAADRVRAAVGDRDLITIHTEEATLEDVFVQFAGRRLE